VPAEFVNRWDDDSQNGQRGRGPRILSHSDHRRGGDSRMISIAARMISVSKKRQYGQKNPVDPDLRYRRSWRTVRMYQSRLKPNRKSIHSDQTPSRGRVGDAIPHFPSFHLAGSVSAQTPFVKISRYDTYLHGSCYADCPSFSETPDLRQVNDVGRMSA